MCRASDRKREWSTFNDVDGYRSAQAGGAIKKSRLGDLGRRWIASIDSTARPLRLARAGSLVGERGLRSSREVAGLCSTHTRTPAQAASLGIRLFPRAPLLYFFFSIIFASLNCLSGSIIIGV